MSVSSRKKSPAWRSTSRKRCSLCSSPNTPGKRGQRKGFQVRGGSKRCQMTACSVSGTRTCSCSLGTAYPPDRHLGTCTTSDHCFIKFTCLLYVCTHMCAHTHMPHQKCAIAHTWKSEDNFVKVRNFQYPFSPSTTWDPGMDLKSISLGSKCLDPLS